MVLSCRVSSVSVVAHFFYLSVYPALIRKSMIKYLKNQPTLYNHKTFIWRFLRETRRPEILAKVGVTPELTQVGGGGGVKERREEEYVHLHIYLRWALSHYTERLSQLSSDLHGQ